MQLKQPKFIYSACRPFPKKNKKSNKFKETEDSKYIYQNELDKSCFQHDITYGEFKNLPWEIASDKALYDKAFNIARSPKNDEYPRCLASIVYKRFDKKLSGSSVKSENILSKKIA